MRVHDCPAVETPEFLFAALEQASDAVVIVDSDRRVRHFNAAAERIWGFSRAEVLGREADRLGLHDHQLQQIAVADQAISGQARRKRDSEITIHHSDGRPIRVALSVSRVAIDGNVSTMAFVRDITVEIVRRDRMALLNLVADRTNRAVVVTDRSLGIVYSNAAFAGLFGYSSEDVIGQHVNQLLAGQHTDRAALARLRRRVGAGFDGDEEILTYDKNGDEIWVSIAAKAFRDERGRIKYLFALLTDITETKQLRSLQQLIMSALALFGVEEMHQLNSLKVLAACLSNLCAVLTFIISGAVIWHYCLISMIFAGAGGYLGASYARRMNASVLRVVVVVTGCVIAGYFFWRQA